MSPQLVIDTDAVVALAALVARAGDDADALARRLATIAGDVALRSQAVPLLRAVADEQELVGRVLESRARAAAAFQLAPDLLTRAGYRAALDDGDLAIGDLLADHAAVRDTFDLPDPAIEAGDVAAGTVDLAYLPLFGPGGPQATDIHQGRLGDCALLATMASVAETHPEWIVELVHDRGDGTYDITIDGEVIRVDADVPVDVNGRPLYVRSDVLWPYLVEKAAAIHATEHGRRRPTVHVPAPNWPALSPGYGTLAIGLTSEWFDTFFGAHGESDVVLVPLTPDDDVVVAIASQLERGVPVTAATLTGMGFSEPHQLAVLAMDGDTVTLQNPWGGFSDGAAASVRAAVPSAEVDQATGRLTMSVDDFLRTAHVVEFGPGADVDGDGYTDVSSSTTSLPLPGPVDVTVTERTEVGSRVHVGTDGIDLGSGSRHSRDVTVGTDSVSTTSGATVYQGVQVRVTSDADVSLDEVRLETHIGGSLGLGLGVDLAVEVHPIEVARDAVEVADTVISVVNPVNVIGAAIDLFP